jgi:hypothetical protein
MRLTEVVVRLCAVTSMLPQGSEIVVPCQQHQLRCIFDQFLAVGATGHVTSVMQLTSILLLLLLSGLLLLHVLPCSV